MHEPDSNRGRQPLDTPASPDDRLHKEPVISSAELFQGQSNVWIQHGDIMYRLRRTGSGKLILTK